MPGDDIPKKPKTRGRPRIPDEEKKNRKQIRQERQKAYLEQLRAEGHLTTVGAARLADKIGVTLDGMAENPEDLTGTYDDPIMANRDPKMQNDLVRNEHTRGPKPVDLSKAEKQQILEYLSIAMGRAASCKQAKVSSQRFHRSMNNDPEFASQVRLTENSLIGMSAMVVYLAGQNGDVQAASKFISLNETRKSSGFNRKMMSLEYQLKQRAVNSQISAMHGSGRPSFATFSNKELDDYESITNKVRSGQTLDPEEAIRLGTYTAKLIAASAPAPAPPTDHVAEAANAPLAIDATYTEDETD